MSTLELWKIYLILLGFVLAVYYLVIVIRYYKKEIYQLGRRLSTSEIKGYPAQHQKEQYTKDRMPGERESEDSLHELTQQVEKICNALTSSLKEAAEKEYPREDLLLLLRMTLKEYPGFSVQPFRSLIERLIESECERYGFVPLHVVERDEIWKEAV